MIQPLLPVPLQRFFWAALVWYSSFLSFFVDSVVESRLRIISYFSHYYVIISRPKWGQHLVRWQRAVNCHLYTEEIPYTPCIFDISDEDSWAVFISILTVGAEVLLTGVEEDAALFCSIPLRKRTKDTSPALATVSFDNACPRETRKMMSSGVIPWKNEWTDHLDEYYLTHLNHDHQRDEQIGRGVFKAVQDYEDKGDQRVRDRAFDHHRRYSCIGATVLTSQRSLNSFSHEKNTGGNHESYKEVEWDG